MTGGRRGAALIVAALAAPIVLLRQAWRIDYPYSIDFQTYWLAGRRLLDGDAARLYEAGGGAAAGIPLTLAAEEFKNLPLVAWGFAPLATLDYLVAKRLFWFILLAALLAAAWLIGTRLLPARFGGPGQRALLAATVLALAAPAHIALRHGQTTPLVLLALAAWMAWRDARPVAGGLALAAATLVKIPTLSLPLLDLVEGRLRSVALWAGATAAAVAVSVMLFGAELHATWARALLSNSGTVMTGHNNQSAAAVAARLVGVAPTRDWTPREKTPAERALGAGLAALALAPAAGLLLRAALRRSRPDGRLLAFPLLAGAIVALPVAWDHYLLLLAAPAAALLAGLDERGLLRRWDVLAALGTGALLLLLPTPGFVIDLRSHPGPGGAALLSHGFLGAVLISWTALRAAWPGPAARA